VLLAKLARSLSVPVVVSIWLSSVASWPTSTCVLPVRSNAVACRVWPAWTCFKTAGRLSSGRVKITEIGCNWVITTMPVVLLVCT